MGTTAQKLAKVEQTKTEIKAAIIAKGVDVPEGTTFAAYATKISEISTGIVPTGNIELQQQSGTDVTNYATASVKSGAVSTPATTITSNPTISINTSTGLITATNSKTQSVTPTVSTAGWISSGTAGTITVSGSGISQLSVQAATTITPTTSEQTAVAANKYTTGIVKVAAIQTETKTATDNGTVTPTSGKYLSSVTVNVPYTIYRTGSGAPSSALGNDGDLYVDIS